MNAAERLDQAGGGTQARRHFPSVAAAGRRTVLRVGLTLAAGGAVVYWLLVALYLWVFRCGDNCGDGQDERWQYTGRFVLATLGASLAVVALAFSFTSRKQGYRALWA